MLDQDFSYALRSLRRHPGFSLFMVAILALGIGPTGAMLSVANGVLLQPLPYQDSDRLALIAVTDDGTRLANSYPDFRMWSEQSELFEELALCSQDQELNLTGGEEPERVIANLVSPSFFELLGVQPLQGRLFLPEENEVPGAHPVIVISHRLWQKHFAGNDVLGKVVQLHGHDYTVVGILPEHFKDFTAAKVDVYVPVMMASVIHRPGFIEERAIRWLEVFGRLRPGATVAEARSEIKAIFARSIQDYPATNETYDATVVPLREFRFDFADLRRAVLVLLAGAAFVILIIYTNVANLMTLRAFERQQEIALKMSLGAGRGRLARQLLAEGMVLSFLGAALGILLAYALTGAFARFIDQAYMLPPAADVSVNLRVVGVIALIALVNGCVSGLAPALPIGRFEMWRKLQAATRSSGKSVSHRFRKALTVAQVTVAMTLLVGAGLALKSFGLLTGTGLGFLATDTLTARFELPASRYSADPEKSYDFYRGVVERARSIPGTEHAGIWGPGMPGYGSYYRPFTPEGRPLGRASEQILAFEHRVTPGLLTEVEMPFLDGRDFRPSDDAESHRVAIVSKTVAETAWPGRNPLGKRFWITAPYEDWVEVVGVVDDVRHRGRIEFASERFLDVFFPIHQMKARRSSIVIHGNLSRPELEDRVREVVKSVDPGIPVYDFRTVGERLADEEIGTRFNTTLMAFYAGFATLLAILGIYSVLAYSVRQRTREIGIRMALGARAGDVVKNVVGQTMVLVAVGLVFGLAGGLVLTRIFSDLFYGVEAVNLAVVAAAAVLFAGVAAVASFVPAREAVRLDPATTVRYE